MTWVQIWFYIKTIDPFTDWIQAVLGSVPGLNSPVILRKCPTTDAYHNELFNMCFINYTSVTLIISHFNSSSFYCEAWFEWQGPTLEQKYF